MTCTTRSGKGIRVGIAVIAAIGLVAGCGTDDADVDASEVCAEVPNGTPITGTLAPAPAPGAPPTTQNLATNPEVATGYRADMTAVRTASYAVSTANPISTQAACEVLRDGGTAADALITAQAVLGLVEPQSSGIGGGGFLLYYNKDANTVDAYDGRETAPAAATENYLRWVGDADQTVPKPDARASGRSIGVPGILRMLEVAHDEHGEQTWGDLFQPAIDLADKGISISPRLAQQIAESAPQLAIDENAREYFLNPDGSPKAEGTTLTNPAMAKTLGAIATDGADALYTGEIARDIIETQASTTGGRTPGQLTLDDLKGYQAKTRTALCNPYRDHVICGMPNPSSGGIAVASTLGVLSNFDLGSMGPQNVDLNGGKPVAQAVHLISEAERLAYADRDKYVADSDFVPLPGNSPDALLNPDYLKQRAGLIDPAKPMGTAQPGDFGPVPLSTQTQDREHGTSQVTVADKYGNVASLTTTIESAFGSFHMVDGFLLNNQLTDFAANPTGSDGTPVANRVQPGKRPRSSMSPTLVFARESDGLRGDIAFATGSPGGSVIIQFVVKTLVNSLDWGLNPQQAVSAVDFGAANTPVTNVGGEHPAIDASDDGANDPLVQQLRAMGMQVSVAPQSSGLSALEREQDGWVGGADPRREGAVMGDVTTG